MIMETGELRRFIFWQVFSDRLLDGGWRSSSSPLTAEQERYFTPVVKSVTAFTTGYLISYMNKFLDMYLFEKEMSHLNRFVAVGIFLICLIVTWITVFLYRYATERPAWLDTTLGQITKPGFSPTQIASVLVECKQHDIQFEDLPQSAKTDDVLGPKDGFTFSRWEIKLPGCHNEHLR